MRPRIKSVKTQNGIVPVQVKVKRELFFVGEVTAIKVTTSGTRPEIEHKFKARMDRSRNEHWRHHEELVKLVRDNNIQTKYFAA